MNIKSIMTENKIINVINIIIFCILLVFTSNILINISLQPDQYYNDIQPFFSFADHGNYVSTAIIRMITYTLPSHLGFHVVDWQSQYARWFRGGVVVLIAYLLSMYTFINIKKTYLQPLVFIINYLAILSTLVYTNFWQVNCAQGVGRFIIPNLFLINFWYFFSLLFIKKEEPKKGKLFFLCISALILGNISEPLSFSSFIALLLLFIFNNISKQKIISNKTILLPIMFIIIGALFMLLNKNYQFWVYGHSGIITIASIVTSLKHYKYFFMLYFQYIISLHWIFYFSLMLLIVLSLKLLKSNDDKRRVIISVFLLIGLLLFYSTFIIAKGYIPPEDTMFREDFFSPDSYYNQYWLNHHDFPVIIRFYLLLTISIALSVLMHFIENSKLFKNIAFTLLILFIIGNLYIIDYKNAINGFINQSKEFKQQVYFMDKLAIFYWKNNKNPIIFAPEPWSKFDYPSFFDCYLKRIYNIEINFDDIIWLDKEKAMEKFYENGGVISEEELENVSFKRLYDYMK